MSKAAADLLAGFYADAHGLRVVRARAFNHAGPGQTPNYAIASFARQVAAGLEAGDDPMRVVTGNPDARRDYTDVRDVVARLPAAGRARASRGSYNVCSGRPPRPPSWCARSARSAAATIDHVVDPALVRAHEVMEMRGDATACAARRAGSRRSRSSTTLADTVAWWREEIRAGRGGARMHE